MTQPRARSLSYRALFQERAREEARCDVCGDSVDDDDDTSGHGLYVWTRGTETRYEEPPLCARCGQALGLAQVRRWQIEDDEEG